MRNVNKFNDNQRAEIQEWKAEIKNLNLHKKIEVLHYATMGYTNAKISELTGYSPSRVSDFIREYTKNGIGYFTVEHRKGGNHRNLSDEQESTIIETFTEKAVAGEIVSLSQLKEEYEKVRGKKTANSTFYGFLERMDWRRIMPRGAHPKKASEEAVEASKKWSRLQRATTMNENGYKRQYSKDTARA